MYIYIFINYRSEIRGTLYLNIFRECFRTLDLFFLLISTSRFDANQNYS